MSKKSGAQSLHTADFTFAFTLYLLASTQTVSAALLPFEAVAWQRSASLLPAPLSFASAFPFPSLLLFGLGQRERERERERERAGVCVCVCTRQKKGPLSAHFPCWESTSERRLFFFLFLVCCSFIFFTNKQTQTQDTKKLWTRNSKRIASAREKMSK